MINQYTFIRFLDTDDRVEVAKEMTELGKEGWEFTGYTEDTGGTLELGTCYLMTRKVPESDDKS